MSLFDVVGLVFIGIPCGLLLIGALFVGAFEIFDEIRYQLVLRAEGKRWSERNRKSKEPRPAVGHENGDCLQRD